MSTEQLNDRMARSKSAMLKKHGFESESALKAQMDELKALKAAETERKQAEMSALEIAQQEVEALKAQSAEREEALIEQRFTAHVNGHCASLGIINAEYARFDVARAADELPEGEQLDVEAHLKARLAEPQYKAAFGIVEPVPTNVDAPAHTSPVNPNAPTPPQPVPGGAPSAQKDVMDMTNEEFALHQQMAHNVTPG